MTLIIWKKPNAQLAFTKILDGSDPVSHAALLLDRGDIPSDWSVAAIGDMALPDWPQEDWRFLNGEIVVDMTAARETTKERLRHEREPLFQKLDARYMRAIEEGRVDTHGPAIAAEKQKLRDITGLADQAQTPEDLVAIRCEISPP